MVSNVRAYSVVFFFHARVRRLGGGIGLKVSAGNPYYSFPKARDISTH
jgi:hypothetical protein